MTIDTMAFDCKVICIRIKAKKAIGKNRYGEGQKHCTICSIFIICDDIRCPCCHVKLRNNAKFSKTRNKIAQKRFDNLPLQ